MIAEVQSQYQVPEIEDLLDDAIALVSQSRPLPMSSTVKVNRDELLDLLEGARDQLPEELRRARWLLKERDDFLAQAQQEADDIIEAGRTQVARMVERQEIVKAAELRARQIMTEAKADARTLRRQVEDYCDQKLASFEVVLERTARTVQQGRDKLLGAAAGVAPDPGGLDEEEREAIDQQQAGSWAALDSDE